MRGVVQNLGHLGVLLGHLRVRLLDARSGLQQRRGGDGFQMADGQHRVAVAGENDLALLGEFEAAVDGALRLGEHRAVGGATASTDGATTAVEQRQSMSCFAAQRDDSAIRRNAAPA